MIQYLPYAGMVLAMIGAFVALPPRKRATVTLLTPQDRARFGDSHSRAPGIR